MMRYIRYGIITLVFLGLMYGLKQLYVFEFSFGVLPSAMSLGFILLGSYFFAKTIEFAGLPKITAYIGLGFLCGPYLFDFISVHAIDDLRLIDDLAIVLIGLSAGGEIKWDNLKRNLRSYLLIAMSLSFVIFVGVGLSVFAIKETIPLPEPRTFSSVLVCVLILGITGVTKSPAATIAIIEECRAKGSVTQAIITVLLILDIFVVVVFTILLALSKFILGVSGGVLIVEFLRLFWEIGGSVVVGIIIGPLARLFLKYQRKGLILLIFGLSVLVAQLSYTLHVDSILMAVTIGFYIENFTFEGKHLLRAIERSNLPIYIVFFTLAGAKLEVDVLRDSWLLALYLTFTTGIFTYIGAKIGTSLAQAASNVKTYLPLGLFSQAGLSLVLAAIVFRELPGLGSFLMMLIIARVSINQIIGPILLKVTLVKAGEAEMQNQETPKGRSDET